VYSSSTTFWAGAVLVVLVELGCLATVEAPATEPGSKCMNLFCLGLCALASVPGFPFRASSLPCVLLLPLLVVGHTPVAEQVACRFPPSAVESLLPLLLLEHSASFVGMLSEQLGVFDAYWVMPVVGF